MISGLSDYVEKLKNRLAGFEVFNKDAIPQLRTLLADCNETDADAVQIAKYSVAKMILAYSENDKAGVVVDALEEQGFRMEDYAYESDIEGNPMHINLVNDISKERLTVVLTPAPNGVQINVHNYGSDGMGNVQTQNMIQQVLQKALGHKGTCHNPGGVSVQVSESDLTNTKNQPVKASSAAQNLSQSL